MILEFSIGNYRSFNMIQTLNFRSTSLMSESKLMDQHNIVQSDDIRVLKTMGLYGSNGSGKSNLLKGLCVFRQLVERSLESESVMILATDPFIFIDKKQDNAGFFQIQILIGGKQYMYGFTLKPQGTVLREWLFGPAEKRETMYLKVPMII